MPPEHEDLYLDIEESKGKVILDVAEENKLASLNEMPKKKQFLIQQEDEEDFEAFLSNLNSKRNQDLKEHH